MEEEAVTKVIDSSEKGPELEGPGALDEIDFAPLRDFFEMERPDSQESERLGFITKWMKQHGYENKSDLIAKLGTLEREMGAPNLGESRLGRIYNWLKIDSEIESLMKEREAYRR